MPSGNRLKTGGREETKLTEPISIFLCGDVMTARGIDQVLSHPGDPSLYEWYVKDARQYVELAERKHGPIDRPIHDADLWGVGSETLKKVGPAARIINLETAVTVSGEFWEEKGIHYRMSPRNVGCLTAAGVDCCVLANNHVLDWGRPGLDETLTTLQLAGLKTAGAGENLRSATEPAEIATASGQTILVFGFATEKSGVPPDWAASEEESGVQFLPDLSAESFARAAETIQAARRDESDIVIVSIHWGSNWAYAISDEERRFAHRLIEEAGVDIVHGHSSHHVKAVEVHCERFILYGCGDLITDYEGIAGNEAYRGDLGLMYFAGVDPETGRLESLRMRPTQMRGLRLSEPTDGDVAWILNTLNRQGRRFGTRVRLEEDRMLHLDWIP